MLVASKVFASKFDKAGFPRSVRLKYPPAPTINVFVPPLPSPNRPFPSIFNLPLIVADLLAFTLIVISLAPKAKIVPVETSRFPAMSKSAEVVFVPVPEMVKLKYVAVLIV